MHSAARARARLPAKPSPGSMPSGTVWRFQIDGESRDALIAGADPIDQTLVLVDDIHAFISADAAARRWAYPQQR